MNVREFNQILQDFAHKDVPELVVTIQKKICLDALLRLVDRTPVDTGRARGNWQVTIGHRAQNVVPDSALPLPLPSRWSLGWPPRHPRPDLSFVGQRAVDDGSKFIRERVVTFCECHLTNNVHYILELEDGKSRQTRPHQILELTFDEIAATYA